MLCRSVRELIIMGWRGSGSRCAAPRRAACGAGSRRVRRTVSALRPAAARAPGPDNMGLEKERAESSVIMDPEEFNRSIEPILLRKGKGFSEVPDDRDPNDINAHVKVAFEDVIAEPVSTHSFDTVWVGSHAAFELVKFLCYRLLSTLLAVPVAFVLGLLFGVLSCLHIWLVGPVIRGFLTFLPPALTVWRKLMVLFVAPLSHSMGKSMSSIQVRSSENK
uniref:Caveolin n=1 Tax=Oryzias latipes TaxID=8090 RepID=A0A3P9LXT4_ORYLA